MLDGAPGAAWAEVVALLPTNAELALDKLRRLAPSDPSSAARLAVALASIAEDVPASGILGRSQIVHAFWVAELILTAEPDDAREFAEAMASAGGVEFLADATARAQLGTDDSERTVSPDFDAVKSQVVHLLEAELDRQSTLCPAETSGVLSLLRDWGILAPSVDRQTWLLSVIDSGNWPIPEILGMFVPTGTASSGDGPSRPVLGDTHLGFLDEVVGLREVVDRMGSLPDLIEEPFFGDSDVSYEARIRRAEQAVARWALANPPTTDPSNGSSEGDGGDPD